MPKIIFEKTEKHLIPEDLQSEAKENEDGTFTLSADGLINKNKELVTKVGKLTRKVEDAERDKAEAEAKADEYRKNPSIPKEKRLVDVADAEFIETAKAEGLTKETFAELKTRAETAESKLAKTELKTIAREVGKDEQAWREHAEINKLRFDTRKEKQGESEQDITFVLFKDAEGKDAEMKLEDYKKEKAAHVKDAEGADNGTHFPRQRKSAGELPEQSVASQLVKKRYAAPKQE